MKTIAAVLTIISLMMVGTTVLAEDQVVTIYFAGTGATVDWSVPANSFEHTGELLAILYSQQLPQPNNGQFTGPHHKFFIDGIGTGCGALGDWSSTAFPEFEGCRGWNTCLTEASNHLKNDVLAKFPDDDVILNLVGWSRGGILTMKFAYMVYNDTNVNPRVKRINILAVDPAGHRTLYMESGVPEYEFCLNDKVNQYVGIYGRDERSAMFGPAIPGYGSTTKGWEYIVPGSHETLVGNTQEDGHHSVHILGCGPLWLNECYHDELSKVSWVTKAIAVKLFNSREWGKVEFDWNWDGLVGEEAKRNTFIQKADEMWDYNDYIKMRKNAYTPLGFEGYGSLFGWEGCTASWMFGLVTGELAWLTGGGYNLGRCATRFSCPSNEQPNVDLEAAVETLYGERIDDLWGKLNELANSPPAALCKDTTVPADSTCKGSALIDNGSFDPDGDPITISQFPSGPYSLGNTSVTVMVTDSKEVSSQCSGTVTVVDNTLPSVAAPAAVVKYTGPGATSCGATISNESLGAVVVNDNCPGVIVTPNGIPANNFFPVGTTTITHTAKDAAGNTVSATQMVTVVDNTPPSITNVSASPNILWPPNHKMAGVTINYNVEDNCGQPVCQISSVTSNEPISSLDYAILDAHRVNLVADREGSGTSRVYTVIITCKDTSENFSSQPVTVTVPHDQGE